VDEIRYDGRDARALLGTFAEEFAPDATREPKRLAARELLGCLAAFQVPGVKGLQRPDGSVEIGIGPLVAEVRYVGDGTFTIAVDGAVGEVSLAFDHGAQRFEGEAGPEATEEDRKRSALADLVRELVKRARSRKSLGRAEP
jgi:hypothetical protein